MPKASFKTPYGEHEKVSAPSGSRIENIYSYVIDSFGRKILKKTGETDIYAKIQESLEETKIENILKRATLGDTSMLRPDGIYADVADMPSNLLEARQAMQKLENTWNSLDNEIKKKYNYNLDEFIGKAGQENWLRDMGLLNEKMPDTVKEAVKEAVKESTKEASGGEVNE